MLFKEATEHRAVLILRGKGLSSSVSDTDPKKEGKPIKTAQALNESPEAGYTADILNQVLERAHKILSAHPLNKERKENGLTAF